MKGIALQKWKFQTYMRDYLACIRSLDDHVGRLQDYLEESGLLESTVFIYSSDQGLFYVNMAGLTSVSCMTNLIARPPCSMARHR